MTRTCHWDPPAVDAGSKPTVQVPEVRKENQNRARSLPAERGYKGPPGGHGSATLRKSDIRVGSYELPDQR